MHNIGRTVRETYEMNYETDHEHPDGNQSEFAASNGGNTLELYNEFENIWGNEYEANTYQMGESPFDEMTENELASELLEVQSEEELDQFLGRLIKRASPQGARNFGQSKGGRMLGGVLKKVAKFALPMAGRVVGGFFGGPVGAKIGGNIGQFTTRAFGLELEGLSAEDQEFELSKALVRFSGSAARNVQTDSKAFVQPQNAVRKGVVTAAKRFMPGLLNPMPGAYRSNADKGVYNHRDYEVNTNQWGQQGSGANMQEF